MDWEKYMIRIKFIFVGISKFQNYDDDDDNDNNNIAL
jgi:hypothetical protein